LFFNSLEFAAFLVVVYAVYRGCGQRLQNRWLLLASYVFYGAWDWRFLGLILLSTVIDYRVGLGLAATSQPRRRQRLVTLSVVANLGILALFKYADFFATGLSQLLATVGLEIAPGSLGLVLPVGISFYTFQTLSYTLDIYRRKLEPTRDFLDFALFVAFFPQLVAGPIERASRLLPQIVERRQITWQGTNSGAWLVMSGIFKKVVVADNLAAMVDLVYARPGAASGLEILLATYAFAWQIYCDFSGYSDVARGICRLLGFELMLNFNLPYLALNPPDFWRRWHISLSTWLRDYLYIPLGGNRGGSWRTYRNLALTMLLGGLWHGAAWTFLVWGAYQGALLIGHRLLRPMLARLAPSSIAGRHAWRALRVLGMFHLTVLGWMIFRADSLAQLGTLIARLFTAPGAGMTPQWWLPLAVLVGPLMAFQAIQASSGDLESVLSWRWPLRTLVYAGVFLLIVTLGEDFGAPFIYFQF